MSNTKKMEGSFFLSNYACEKADCVQKSSPYSKFQKCLIDGNTVLFNDIENNVVVKLTLESIKKEYGCHCAIKTFKHKFLSMIIDAETKPVTLETKPDVSEKIGRKYLAIEDECAPDARGYFRKELSGITGFTIEEFEKKGKKVDFGYQLKGFQLDHFPEEPYYHLSEISEETILTDPITEKTEVEIKSFTIKKCTNQNCLKDGSHHKFELALIKGETLLFKNSLNKSVERIITLETITNEYGCHCGIQNFGFNNLRIDESEKLISEKTEIEIIPVDNPLMEISFGTVNIEKFEDLKTKLMNSIKVSMEQDFDISKKTGEKKLRSHIAALRKLKKPISDTHKLLKKDSLAFSRALDKRKNELVDIVEKTITHHKSKLDELDYKKKIVSLNVQIQKDKVTEKVKKDLLKEELEEKRLQEEFKKNQEEQEKIRLEKEKEENIRVDERNKVEQEILNNTTINNSQENESSVIENVVETFETNKPEGLVSHQISLSPKQETVQHFKPVQCPGNTNAGNLENKKRINNEVLQSLLKLGWPEKFAKDFMLKVVKGEIAHLSINY